MLVDDYALPHTFVIEVIADGEGSIKRATLLAQALRTEISQTDGRAGTSPYPTDYAVSLSYRTNQRKAFERARKNGASVILTVRPGGGEDENTVLVDAFRSVVPELNEALGFEDAWSAFERKYRVNKISPTGPFVLQLPNL